MEIRIYSVGVWNAAEDKEQFLEKISLEFTPLEFETQELEQHQHDQKKLEFTPLEFETKPRVYKSTSSLILEFTPLEFETNRSGRESISKKN